MCFKWRKPNAVALSTARKRLSRVAFVRYIQAQTEPSLFIMEACGMALYWARFVQTLGHHCVLLHARYVKPYRQRNKTDRNDCDAILEAARASKMHPVPVKTDQQQMIQHLHRLREQWKGNRTQHINLLRSIFRELGIETPNSVLSKRRVRRWVKPITILIPVIA